MPSFLAFNIFWFVAWVLIPTQIQSGFEDEILGGRFCWMHTKPRSLGRLGPSWVRIVPKTWQKIPFKVPRVFCLFLLLSKVTSPWYHRLEHICHLSCSTWASNIVESLLFSLLKCLIPTVIGLIWSFFFTMGHLGFISPYRESYTLVSNSLHQALLGTWNTRDKVIEWILLPWLLLVEL